MPHDPILALTVHPEWAWAKTHLDKRVENRSPAFAAQIARRVGDGWLAIHAGAHIGGRPGVASMRSGMSLMSIMAGGADWMRTARDFDAGCYTLESLECHDRFAQLTPDAVTTSAIVALAKLGEVLPPGVARRWKVTDSAAIVLADVVVLDEPIRCKGRQGLWTPADDVQAQLCAVIERIGGER